MLDIGPFLADPGSPAGQAFTDQLGPVLHDIGFFYVIGHGVDRELAGQAHAVARRFFDLPEAERLRVENVNSPHFRGYTRFGHEFTNGRSDLRDQLDIGREQAAPRLGPDDPTWLRLRGPNQWPDQPDEFRPVISEWMAEMERVGASIVRAMAITLGLPADHFSEMVSPAEILLKVIRYLTPADATPSAAARQGVGAHRDTGFVSMIHQDTTGGLQVDRNGSFVDVPSVDDTLVVNVGEMFQLVTRGYFRATVHRVVSPAPGTERISLAFFYNPRLEATLEPVELPEDLAALAAGGDSDDPDNPILANYGENSMKVRLRAHPDVAARHHADLLTTRSLS